MSVDKLRNLVKAVAGSSVSEASIQYIFTQLSGPQPYDFPAMLRLMADQITCPASKEDLLISFQAFDVDGDGFVTPEEMKSVLASEQTELTSQDIDDIVRAAGVSAVVLARPVVRPPLPAAASCPTPPLPCLRVALRGEAGGGGGGGVAELIPAARCSCHGRQ